VWQTDWKSGTSKRGPVIFSSLATNALEAGKLAEMIVLDRDLLIIAPEKVLNSKLYRNVMGGKVRYERA